MTQVAGRTRTEKDFLFQFKTRLASHVHTPSHLLAVLMCELLNLSIALYSSERVPRTDPDSKTQPCGAGVQSSG